MPAAQDYYPECPEGFLVSLARSGDRSAFEELVRRRQSSVRNLLRRCSGDYTLSDDLAQQVFLKVCLKIRKLREARAFGAWLSRVAVSVWLQHIRKKDALRGAAELADTDPGQCDSNSVGMDLDRALAKLSQLDRLCTVLSYHEGMSHQEIAELTKIPLGTVKSNIRRGAQQLQDMLSAYGDMPDTENSP